jgi:DNA-binding NtrC family response regulator
MNASKGSILIVDDDPHIRLTLGDRLKTEGYEVESATDGPDGLERIGTSDPDVVLLDLQMPGLDGMQVLEQLRQLERQPTVVLITAYGSVERAVEAMRAGAFDFLTKPFQPDRISVVVEKAMERERLRRENAYLRAQGGDGSPTLIGQSPTIQAVVALGHKAAASSATVLLLGESGSGKEVLARNIHLWGPRHDKPFMVVNCVALPAHLLESELFGHERGAFTGAERQRKGRFELARGGTVFLDEIGATRPDFQLRLLRVLQEGTFVRIGGEQELSTDIRIIAATNRDLQELVDAGDFLADLYYRLNVVPIHVPPLREHKEDIPELAAFFLHKHAHEAKRDMVGIADAALERMRAYDWPGNVREMENAIQRAIVLGNHDQIVAADLPGQLLEADGGGDVAAGYHDAVEGYKRRLLEKALQQTGGNQSKAAELLGIQRSFLSRMLKRMDLR